MLNRNLIQSLRTGALCLLSLCAGAVSAQQEWPNKAVHLIVGFAPGGGTDIVGRALAARMTENLGQTVIVENKAGAAGTIAADMISR